MPKHYTKLKGIGSEVYRLKEDGLTNREIAAYFGVTREQILLPRKPMKMNKNASIIRGKYTIIFPNKHF